MTESSDLISSEWAGWCQVTDVGFTYSFRSRRRVIWGKTEHPFPVISLMVPVCINRNEAQNAALRRRCSAYRRRQDFYAKTRAELQSVLDVHNWVRPHWDLGKQTTPAMAMPLLSPLINRKNPLHERISMYLLLTSQYQVFPEPLMKSLYSKKMLLLT